MDGGGGVVAIVAIGCGTGIVWMFFETVKASFLNRGGKRQDALAEELKALRLEVGQLRQQNNDLILSFDNTLTRVDRRVQHLEAGTEQPSLPEGRSPVGALR